MQYEPEQDDDGQQEENILEDDPEQYMTIYMNQNMILHLVVSHLIHLLMHILKPIFLGMVSLLNPPLTMKFHWHWNPATV